MYICTYITEGKQTVSLWQEMYGQVLTNELIWVMIWFRSEVRKRNALAKNAYAGNVWIGVDKRIDLGYDMFPH